MSSNNLLSNLYSNSLQLNNLVANKLNVNNYNFFKNNILLVLITLNIQNANLYTDYIEFEINDLKLTEWEQRTNGDSIINYNEHYNHKNKIALDVLIDLWNNEYQKEYSFSLHSPNANLTILTLDDMFIEHYIIINNYKINDNLITLYIKSQNNSPIITEKKNVPIKILIDDSYLSLKSSLSIIFNRLGDTQINNILSQDLSNDFKIRTRELANNIRELESYLDKAIQIVDEINILYVGDTVNLAQRQAVVQRAQRLLEYYYQRYRNGEQIKQFHVRQMRGRINFAVGIKNQALTRLNNTLDDLYYEKELLNNIRDELINTREKAWDELTNIATKDDNRYTINYVVNAAANSRRILRIQI